MRKRIKKIPREVRKIVVSAKAKDFITRNKSIDQLPIDPFQLYEENGWILLTWTEAKSILNVEDPLLLKSTGAEARTSIIRGENIYITVYDDTITPSTRIRWTIAHEIGHIVLDHLIEFEKTAINRGGLQPKEYGVLEDEANLFAAELLTPYAILNELGATKSEDIRFLCNVSAQASSNRARAFEWKTNRSYDHCDRKMLAQFGYFLNPISICSNSVISIFDMEYAHLIRPNTSKRWENMKHIAVEVDSDNRFTQCPQCGNHKFSASARHCRICGLYLFNECSNYGEQYMNYEKCGAINPGDARHCEKCGETTYLMRMGLLTKWTEWKKNNDWAREIYNVDKSLDDIMDNVVDMVYRKASPDN